VTQIAIKMFKLSKDPICQCQACRLLCRTIGWLVWLCQMAPIVVHRLDTVLLRLRCVKCDGLRLFTIRM
jgi:hypothetical protein